jgi:hypothetical protein
MSTLFDGLHAAFHEPNTRICLAISLLVVEAVVPDGGAADPTLRRLDRAILLIYLAESPLLDAPV